MQQIVTNTPIWVWALLAFLIYRGLMSSRSRDVSFKRTFIIPIVMLLLSIQGIASAFGTNAVAGASWLVFAVAGSLVSWRMFRSDQAVAYPDRQIVHLRGSWNPLALMMGIFFTKYAVAVALAMKPGLGYELAFVFGICALYGLFNGIFIGQALRLLSIYRAAQVATIGQLPQKMRELNASTIATNQNFSTVLTKH